MLKYRAQSKDRYALSLRRSKGGRVMDQRIPDDKMEQESAQQGQRQIEPEYPCQAMAVNAEHPEADKIFCIGHHTPGY